MDDKKKEAVKKEEIKQPVESEVEILKKQAEEYKNKYLRALADYQNFERRIRDEKDETIRFARASVISQILPVLDSIEQAEVFVKDKGLAMVRNHFTEALKRMGVEELDVVKKEFDPQVAEAIEVVLGEKDNEVVEVLRKGYSYQGKVLRPAQVKVTKKEI